MVQTICDLKAELKAKGIKGYSGKNKAELIAMLGKTPVSAPVKKAPAPALSQMTAAEFNAFIEEQRRREKERAEKARARIAADSVSSAPAPAPKPAKKAPAPAPAPAPKPAKAKKAPAKKAPAKSVSVNKQVGDFLTKKFEDTTKGEDGLTKGEISTLKMAKALVNASHLNKKEKESLAKTIKDLEEKRRR
tara:strand:- start:417 stop:989 length:573 start_codon:yes stop_codon:yes gene_type:complete